MNNFLIDYNQNRNVTYLTSTEDKTFEDNYIQVRSRENRIYDDSELKNLPNNSLRHQKEWILREESLSYFIKYIKTKKNSNILEIGCGNGWLANQIVQNSEAEVYALDLNEVELQQGGRVFLNNRLNFVYGNIFYDECNIFYDHFDLIYLAASIQYFPEINRLLNRLQSFLTVKGSIHIFDSPFYSKKERLKAQKRSLEYYIKIGIPLMSASYYHHTWEQLNGFNPKIIYNPSKWQQLIFKRKNPFPWISINKN